MALAKQNKNFFSFAAGIFTEASPLNRPENTSVDEQNFEILRHGYRRRRHGLGLQPSNPTESISVAASAYFNDLTTFETYRWDNVGGDPDKTFHVVKGVDYLYFLEEINGELVDSGISVYMTGTSTAILIDDGPGSNDADRASIAYNPVTISSGNGYLFITGKYLEPFYLEYDATLDDVILRKVDPIERDLEGADDNYGVATVPTTNDLDHRYNLYNQGWIDQTIDGAVSGSYAGGWFTVMGTYPSNAMQWQYGKYVDPASGVEQFSAIHLSWQAFGDVPAPKGKFYKRVMDKGTEQGNRFASLGAVGVVSIQSTATPNITVTTNEAHGLAVTDTVSFINPNIYLSTNKTITRCLDGWYVVTAVTATTFTIAALSLGVGGTQTWYPLDEMLSIHPNVNQSITSGKYDTLVDDEERFSVCEFHAQRLWLAGHSDKKYGRRVYYSQIIRDQKDIGAFHQEADPTSEHISDLLATDGGYVSIPEMGKVLQMKSYGHFLIVLADNGVWVVTPGDLGYFTADNYGVSKLVETDVIFPQAAVSTPDMYFFWSTSGLYVVTAEDITKAPTVQNLSKVSIQQLYSEIITDTSVARSIYDEVDNRIYWFYNEGVVPYDFEFNRALVFDLNVGAFYKYTFPVAGTDVTETGFQMLSATVTKEYVNDQNKVKILTRNGSTVKFYEFNEDATFADYIDFITSVDGWAPPTYLTTTYEDGEDAARRKYATYLTTHFNRTETEAVASGSDLVLSVPSSCMLTAKWNWTNRTTGEKASKAAREIYRLKRYYQPDAVGPWDNGLPITTTKNKLRGSGKTLQLHFSVPDYHDCQLLGWQLNMTGVTET